MHIIKSLILIVFIFSLDVQSNDSNEIKNFKVHILKPGDTLSELLQKNNYNPIYGDNNWLSKVLEINHLTLEDAKKIKKDLPIILPSDNNLEHFDLSHIVRDEVHIHHAANMQTGLLANSITKHQNYAIRLQYFQRALNINNATGIGQENFALALVYNDKNNRRLGSYNYNPYAELGIQAHGSTYFENDTINFRPTYFSQTGVAFKVSENLKLGPNMVLDSQSRVDQVTSTDFTIRRDSLLWLGAKASLEFENNNTTYNLSSYYISSVFSESEQSSTELTAQRLGIDFEFNLLNNYFIGLMLEQETYQNIATDNMLTVGLNFRYILD